MCFQVLNYYYAVFLLNFQPNFCSYERENFIKTDIKLQKLAMFYGGRLSQLSGFLLSVAMSNYDIFTCYNKLADLLIYEQIVLDYAISIGYTIVWSGIPLPLERVVYHSRLYV